MFPKLHMIQINQTQKKSQISNRFIKKDPPATKSELAVVENNIPDANSLVKKTDLNTKITEIEHKIPNITVLATIRY